MKKRTFLYIPLAAMFLFTLSALAVHFYHSTRRFDAVSLEFQLAFISNGTVKTVTPETEVAGLLPGDKLVAVNGRNLESEQVYVEELSKAEEGKPVTIAVERKTPDGQNERLERSVYPTRINKNLAFYSQIFIGLIWVYVIPTFCILLGLWTVLARPRDFLAWLLLFLLLGVASIGLEGYPRNSLVGVFRNIFFSAWSLAMLLFGIYFPERWSWDKKLPWAKWIFIVPLGFQILLTLLTQLKIFFGINLVDYLDFLAKPYENIAVIINMLAISVFFAAFGYKSATLENPDARRRMKLTAYGTSAAMLPSFIVVLYAAFTGRTGSFFDVAPWWFALFALFMMLLFPLTLAYVIVVHRTMDVSVVVRQGLQYALATGGVRVLQFLLLLGIGLGVRWSINNYGYNVSAQIGFIVGGIALVPLIDLVASTIDSTDRRRRTLVCARISESLPKNLLPSVWSPCQCVLKIKRGFSEPRAFKASASLAETCA